MKTKLLFAAALLLSGATFAQSVTTKSEQASSVKAQTNNSGNSVSTKNNSTSDITVKSGTVDKTVKKTDQVKQETQKAVLAQKEAVKARTHEDIGAAQKAESGKDAGSAGTRADVNAGSESKNNKVSHDAYLDQRAGVSAENKGSGKKTEKQGQARLKTQTASTVQSTDHVKTQTENSLLKTSANTEKEAKKPSENVKANAKASSATAIHAGTGIATSSKAKPASFKMHTQIKSAAGLKIK